MRRLSLIPLLLAPLSAQAAPQCPAAASTPAADAPLSAVHVAIPQTEDVRPLRVLSPSEIDSIPALRRIASQGAGLSDLGVSHGLRGIFARSGERFQVFYLAPDGAAVVGGIMWDDTGHDVTRDQVEPIDGTIPTVRYDASTLPATNSDPAPAPAIAKAADAERSTPSPVAALDHVTYGLAGRAGAPRLWMFIDPLCPFSVRAMATLQPYVDAGRLQLAVIPISVNDHENNGESTKAALFLLSQDRDHMVPAWTNHLPMALPIDAAPSQALSSNKVAAEEIHLRGTPTLIWTSSDGTQHQAAGLPDTLEPILLGRPA